MAEELTAEELTGGQRSNREAGAFDRYRPLPRDGPQKLSSFRPNCSAPSDMLIWADERQRSAIKLF